MLAGQWRRAELPDNLPGLPVDDDDRRDVPKTQRDVAVRQLGEAVGVRPLLARILHGCDVICLGVKVLPGTPFPHDLSVGSHLDEIIRVHLALMFLTGQSALNFWDEITRQRSETYQ